MFVDRLQAQAEQLRIPIAVYRDGDIDGIHTYCALVVERVFEEFVDAVVVVSARKENVAGFLGLWRRIEEAFLAVFEHSLVELHFADLLVEIEETLEFPSFEIGRGIVPEAVQHRVYLREVRQRADRKRFGLHRLKDLLLAPSTLEVARGSAGTGIAECCVSVEPVLASRQREVAAAFEVFRLDFGEAERIAFRVGIVGPVLPLDALLFVITGRNSVRDAVTALFEAEELHPFLEGLVQRHSDAAQCIDEILEALEVDDGRIADLLAGHFGDNLLHVFDSAAAMLALFAERVDRIDLALFRLARNSHIEIARDRNERGLRLITLDSLHFRMNGKHHDGIRQETPARHVLSPHAQEEDIDPSFVFAFERVSHPRKGFHQALEDIGIALGNLVQDKAGLPGKRSSGDQEQCYEEKPDAHRTPLVLIILILTPGSEAGTGLV